MIKAQKTQLLETFKTKEGDTGSTEVQVALLTTRIKQLTSHMTSNKHDFNTQRALLILVGQRRRLLKYLSKENAARYNALIAKLGLRK